MTKKIKCINCSIKWSSFWFKGLVGLPLSFLLQAEGCQRRGYAPIRDMTIHQYKETIEDSKDISKEICGLDKLYEVVQFGDEAKIKVVLDRLHKNKQSGFRYSVASFPNTINRDSKRTPLGKAIEDGNQAIVRLLIAHEEIDPNNVGDNKTALVLAIEQGKPEIALDILNRYPNNTKLDIIKPNLSGATPLHLAIEHNDIPLIKQLIKRLSLDYTVDKLSTADHKGRSPLHIAARYNNHQAFKLLLEQIGQPGGIAKLFEKDQRGNSVFANAYLPRNFGRKILKVIYDGDSKTFEYILKLVAKDFTLTQWQAIEGEINTLSIKQLKESYADRLHQLVAKYKS